MFGKILNKFTNPLLGSDLLKSKRSVITVNATRNARPSSNNKPMCDGPMTICLTGVFSDCNACGLCEPYLLILSATSRILYYRLRNKQTHKQYRNC